MNGVLMSFLASFIILLPAAQTIENTSVLTENILQKNMTYFLKEIFSNPVLLHKHSPVTKNSNISTKHPFHRGLSKCNRKNKIKFLSCTKKKEKRYSKRQSEKDAKRDSDHIIKDSTDPNKPKLRRQKTGRESIKSQNPSKPLMNAKSHRLKKVDESYENGKKEAEKYSLERHINYYDIANSKRRKEKKDVSQQSINNANSLQKKPVEIIYKSTKPNPSIAHTHQPFLNSNYTSLLFQHSKLNNIQTKESFVSGQFLQTHRTKRLPQAIIVGVKKAGTRALLEFLKLHPNVEIAGPETHFFDKHYHKGLEWYREKMPASREDQVTIEKTPSYFVTKEAPQRIRKMNKNTKIIIVIRDPVTRAISDYAQARSKRQNLLSFEEMVFLGRWAFERNSSKEKLAANERLIHQNYANQNSSQAKDINEKRICDTWGPVRIGLYARYMRRWLRHFPLQQIHFVHGEKLIVDPSGELALLQNFLRLPHYIGEHFFVHDPVKGFPCLRLPVTSLENTSSSFKPTCYDGCRVGNGFEESGENDGKQFDETSLTRKRNKKTEKNIEDNNAAFKLPFVGESNNYSLLKNYSKNQIFEKYQNTVVIQTRCLGETKGRKHPQVKAEIIKKLRDFYRPHNQIFYKQSKINFGWP